MLDDLAFALLLLFGISGAANAGEAGTETLTAGSGGGGDCCGGLVWATATAGTAPARGDPPKLELLCLPSPFCGLSRGLSFTLSQ